MTPYILRSMKLKYGLLFASMSLISGVYAQKKPLDHSVYDSWKSISQAGISKSGNLIIYSISPQEGDVLTEVKNNKNQVVLSIPRGTDIRLTDNEQFLFASIKPFFQDVRQARIKKKKPDDMPKDTLLIYNFKLQKAEKLPNVKTYHRTAKGNNYIAYLGETIVPSATAAKDTTEQKAGTDQKASKKKEKPTPTVHLLNLNTGDTTNFLKAENFQISDNEQYLLFTKKGAEKDSLNEAGLYLYDIAKKQLKKISNGKGTYKQFTFDDAGQQLSFLADKSPEKALLKDYKLYYYTPKQDTARILADQHSAGIPDQWYVSGDASLRYSESGKRLFFGLAPIPRVKDTTLVDFETVKLDIWHWQDDFLQPMQLLNSRTDQMRSYTAMILPQSSSKITPLSDKIYNRISFADDGDHEWVLASGDADYRVASQWEGGMKSDVYVLSTLSGKNKQVVKSLAGSAYLSPKADYVVYFNQENGNWYSYHINSEKTVQLNEGLDVSFVDEENDVPALPGSYGSSGWTADGKNIFINDRYDIWKFSLDGKRKSLLTQGQGRKREKVFRYQNLSRQENPRIRTTYINEDEPIYLTGFDQKTKYAGLYLLKKKDIRELITGPYTYKMFSADSKIDQLIYTKEDYQASPDLYLNTAFNNEQRLTDINPQQANYNWGTAELVEWTTPKGYQAEGILYKPEDFDPNKKYPIIAYFYEKLSDGLYTYQAPAPTPSRLNISYFVSNGYLVFAPDIRYENGYPGKSAEEYINSGMHHLARTHSWVDSTKMGIQGQSWGGYQVAHLITRTNMYAAAWSGAPVVNMTSAYGGIRWGTGMSRQFQYENTQSRIGKPLWEALDLYIENSPLFFMDRVNTPVAIMHNDNDGAVPWYQGIEFFTALRRLNKPVWLLNYNGDGHNLMNRQNRKDIQIREIQFFDHFLKGKPAANWIKKGVKATEKGIDWGLETD